MHHKSLVDIVVGTTAVFVEQPGPRTAVKAVPSAPPPDCPTSYVADEQLHARAMASIQALKLHLSDQTVAGLGECHDRGRGAAALRVGDDCGLATLHSRHCGVCGSQINANNLRAARMAAHVWLNACMRVGRPRRTAANTGAGHCIALPRTFSARTFTALVRETPTGRRAPPLRGPRRVAARPLLLRIERACILELSERGRKFAVSTIMRARAAPESVERWAGPGLESGFVRHTHPQVSRRFQWLVRRSSSWL
jgi:NAD-specific glutamate dehydrogenase